MTENTQARYPTTDPRRQLTCEHPSEEVVYGDDQDWKCLACGYEGDDRK